MRKIFYIMVLAMMAMEAEAQKITATTTVVDMGQVQFYTPTRGVFELKNTGRKALTISKVDTGCGCTVATYPTKPIAAGENFTVSVTYDARVMGHFDRAVDVYSNGSKTPLQLNLRGVVVEKVTDYIGNFPYQLGELTADSNNVDFGDVRLGEMFQQKFHIYNPTGQKVQPQILHLPDYLKAEISPSVVSPNHSAEVTLTLDSRKIRDYGLTQTEIYLGDNPGDKVARDKVIDVNIVLLPAIQEMTLNQRETVPKIQMSATHLDLTSTDGKKRSETIDILNTGKSRLDIQNLQLYTTGINVQLNKRILLPGEYAKLKITTEPLQLNNLKTVPRILMITNDPDQPKVVIDVKVK